MTRRAGDLVIGEHDGEEVTLDDLVAGLQRVAAMPPMVPVEDRLPEGEWAEAVVVRGEAPYGRCGWCRCPKGVAGCLNLCDMPAGMARTFTDGLLRVVAEKRAEAAWLEALGDCSCGPARMEGYQTERESHGRSCPMNPANASTGP